MTPQGAETRLLILTTTRWTPVGMTFGLVTFVPLDRGLSLSQLGTLIAAGCLLALVFQLPITGIATTLGNRSVLLAAAALALVATTTLAVARDPTQLSIAVVAVGVSRGLDIGVLEAWYVDALRARAPLASFGDAIARAGGTIGTSVAFGVLVCGLLATWDPVPGWSALVLPALSAAALTAVHLVAVALLIPSPSRAVPRISSPSTHRIRTSIHLSIHLALTTPTLRWVLLSQAVGAAALVATGTLIPAQLVELTGGHGAGAAVFGPAAAVGWVLHGLGTSFVAVLGPRIGFAATAAIGRGALGLVVLGLSFMTQVEGVIAGMILALLALGVAHAADRAAVQHTVRPDEIGDAAAAFLAVTTVAAGVSSFVLLPLADVTTMQIALVAAAGASFVSAAINLPLAGRRRRG
ncbi:MFS transporter [Homoserinibacter sp. GY 40078]|uniref:MFS transporter n=1 Tax=Homoserinibacter sp. GY 40078 TaxID=2603275 RepID=UPI0011CB473C|nr:MFS transporter [Homoserinibacter sp. GY 40078]TXK17103.1 MFS transporter [Homoserinibacter sp. GY 40078]